jgi:ribose transport system substrate-binding protein
MKKIRSVFWRVLVLLVIFMMISMIGCSRTKDGASISKTIGRVVFDMSHPYQQADNSFSEERAKFWGASYIYLDGKSDAEAQANGVTDLISRRVSGIIVQPLDGAAIQASIDEALAAKIPIVTFYQQCIKKNVPSVKIDEASSSRELGALAARKWLEWYPTRPIKIAIIDQPDVAFVVENRSDAFIAGVKSVAPNAEVVVRLDGKGVRDSAMAAGDDLLQSHPEANVIYGINSDSSLGALAAYEAGGRGKAVNGIPQTELFIGTDGTESELLKIFDPTSSFKMSMALSAKANGEALVDTVMKIINGDIPMEGETIVTTQNKIIDFYSMTIDDGQKFLADEYKSAIDLRKEIGI